MRKTFEGIVFAAFAAVLLFAMSGIEFSYKETKAAGWMSVPQPAGFTPNGYASLTASAASSSVPLATNAATTPPAVTALVTNTGANIAYVLMGASTVAVTSTTGLPIPAGTSHFITVNNATHMAGISAAGTTLSVVTGY